jgi:hypothetical protein
LNLGISVHGKQPVITSSARLNENTFTTGVYSQLDIRGHVAYHEAS